MTTWKVIGLGHDGEQSRLEPDHVSDEPVLNPKPGIIMVFKNWNLVPDNFKGCSYANEYKVYKDGKLYAKVPADFTGSCPTVHAERIEKKPDWWDITLTVRDRDLV